MKIDTIDFINGNSIELVKEFGYNEFDLVICDSPYGIGMSKSAGKSKKITDKAWDNSAPDKEFFQHLKRISKNQIIFGANHFMDNLPVSKNSSGWIFWDKRCQVIPSRTYADGELAWTSFNRPLRVYYFLWDGFLQRITEKRIHPTQKPVNIYKWILENYANPGDKILDTFGGSFSSAIACNELGFDLTIIEIDKEYYENGVSRYKEITSQTKLF